MLITVKKEMVGHKTGELSITKHLGYRTKKSKKTHKKNR